MKTSNKSTKKAISKKATEEVPTSTKTNMEHFNISVPKHLLDDNVRKFLLTVTDMADLYAKKNHDYGNSFDKGMNEIGMAYGVGRLFDKLNRIITLTKTDAAVSEESIKDTVLDLGCYSVMLYNYIVYSQFNNK